MPAVTLEQLLESRDHRAEHQKDLLERFPGKSLLCLTVQLPGPEKRNALSLAIARAGVEAVRAAFSPAFEELRDLETGYEGYFLLDAPADAAKRTACQLEDTHPLGRLIDLDVMQMADQVGHDGTVMPGVTGHPAPLGREALGLPPRRCLLCNQPARVCMRAHTHSPQELLSCMETMVKGYETSV